MHTRKRQIRKQFVSFIHHVVLRTSFFANFGANNLLQIFIYFFDKMYQNYLFVMPCNNKKIVSAFYQFMQLPYSILSHPVKDVTRKNIERDYLKKEKWLSSKPFEQQQHVCNTKQVLVTTTSCLDLPLYDTGILFSKNGFRVN